MAEAQDQALIYDAGWKLITELRVVMAAPTRAEIAEQRARVRRRDDRRELDDGDALERVARARRLARSARGTRGTRPPWLRLVLAHRRRIRADLRRRLEQLPHGPDLLHPPVAFGVHLDNIAVVDQLRML